VEHRYYKHEAFYGDDYNQAAVITDAWDDQVEFQVSYGWSFGWPLIAYGARHLRLTAQKFAERYPNRVPFEKF
jgi:hypothetical protein